MQHTLRWNVAADMWNILPIVIEHFLTSYAVVSVLCLTVNDEKLSEKMHKQCRASKATKVDFGTKQVVLQKLFLTNITNKQNFFTIISSEFNWHCGNWH